MQPGPDGNSAVTNELPESHQESSGRHHRHVVISQRHRPTHVRDIHDRQRRKDQQIAARQAARSRPIHREQWSLVKVPNPQSVLDHGYNDPFSALPTGLPQNFVGQHLKKIEMYLPALVSSMPTDDQGPRFAHDLLRMAVQNKALVHCMFTATLLFDRVRTEIPEPSQMELHVTTQAVKYLREQMINPATAVHEANVWAVVILGYCGPSIPVRTGKLPTQTSALRELQYTHIWGRLATDKTHEQGLRNLIQILGGLEKLKTSGMPSLITFAHMLDCSRTFSRVSLPYVPFSTAYLDGDRLALTHLEREWARPTLGTLGTSFKEVWPEPDPAVQALQRVIRNMCDFTIIVENHAQGFSNPRKPVALTDQRNHTHHGLLLLPSAQELENQGIREYDRQYEPCRLACNIYSLLVVLPLPPLVKLFEKLSGRLQRSLKRPPGQTLSRKQLQIWILTMGAIISIGTSARVWFVVELAPLVAGLSHAGYVEILQGFLWHPRTSRGDGLELWKELNEAA